MKFSIMCGYSVWARFDLISIKSDKVLYIRRDGSPPLNFTPPVVIQKVMVGHFEQHGITVQRLLRASAHAIIYATNVHCTVQEEKDHPQIFTGFD